MADKAKENNNQKRIIILLIIIIVVLVAAGGILAFRFLNQEKPDDKLVDIQDGNTPKIGYAEGVTVTRDEDALQNAVDDMASKMSRGEIMLEYTNEASSTDGENFTGYLANADENTCDIYFDMYADDKLTDEIYLSGLVPPGKALEKFKLNRKLEKGDHSVVLIFTAVEDDHATIRSQTQVRMTLRVK